MKIKIWNGNHENYISFKRIENKLKLRTLYFNNVKNAEARHEVLEDTHAMDNFALVNETKNVKDYLLALIVEDMKLFSAFEQGSGEMSDSLIVIVVPKDKVAASNWMSALCRKEVKVKDKHNT